MSLLALLTGTTAPEPENGPAWRNIASTTRPQYGDNTKVAETFTSTVDLTIRANVEQITLVYGAGTAKIEALGNDVSYSATVNGLPVTWGGQESGLCLDGQSIESDPLDISLNAGDVITVSTTANAPGAYVAISQTWVLSPVQVRGWADCPSVLILGSSTGLNALFNTGFEEVGIPLINGSVGGGQATSFTNTALDILGVTGDHGITHAFIQAGIGSSSHGSANMCQYGIDLAWRCRNRGIKNVTAMVWKPYTDSTDGWATVEGQTPKYPSRAIAVAWLRNGAPVTANGKVYDPAGTSAGALYVGQPGHPFTDICDWSSLIQDESNIDVYRVDNGPITADGLHINATGYELGRPVLRDWAQGVMDSWTPAP